MEFDTSIFKNGKIMAGVLCWIRGAVVHSRVGRHYRNFQSVLCYTIHILPNHILSNILIFVHLFL